MRKIVIILLMISQNICMFWLRNYKIHFQLHALNLDAC